MKNLFSVCFLCLLLPLSVRAEEKKKELSPETKKKLEEETTELGAAKKKAWQQQLTEEIGKIREVTGLDDAGVKSLQESGVQITDKCLADWQVNFAQYFKEVFESNTEENVSTMLDQIGQNLQIYVSNNYLAASEKPVETAEWKDAVQKILNPDQRKSWQEVLTKRSEAKDKELNDFLTKVSQNLRARARERFLAKFELVKTGLTLSAEKNESLQTLIKELSEEEAAHGIDQLKDFIKAMPPGNELTDLQPSEDVAFQEELENKWNQRLATILSPEELAKAKQSKEREANKRFQSINKLFIVEIDQKVALTDAQRKKLEPLTANALSSSKNLFRREQENNYGGYDRATLYAAANKIDDAKLQEIFDQTQMKQWSAARKSPPQDRQNYFETKYPPLVKPTVPPDAEAMERAISSYMFDKTKPEKKQLIEDWVTKADDVIRIAHLDGPKAARFHTAGRGAAEEALANWRRSQLSTVENRLDREFPEAIQHQLAGLESYVTRRTPDSTESKIWNKTIEVELSAEQQADLKRELASRKDYRTRAIATFILAELNEIAPLTDEQWNKLLPELAELISTYEVQIQQMFSYSGSIWYLQYQSLFIPMGGIPAEELKAILRPDQSDRLKKQESYSEAISYWENIEQRKRARRVIVAP